MPPAHAAAAHSEPPFDMRDDGRVKTTWKTLAAVVGFAAMAGGAYYKLQDHDRRLAAIENKVDQTQQIAIEIRASLRK
jgi:hypothetical protein